MNPQRVAAGSGLSSKDKILRSAEMLFSMKGFRQVSVREIAAHAGVNPALIGYYFRGKQALFNEIYRSHAIPLCREQTKRLKAITERNRVPSLEEVIKAYIIPWLRIGPARQQDSLHIPATVHLAEEQWQNTQRISIFNRRVHTAFIDTLHQCLTNLTKETLMWRLHFIVGAVNSGIRIPGPLRALSKGRCDPLDLEMLLAQIIPFAVRALEAPEPEAPKKARNSKSAIRD
jgi:AcrR family transcriptional regulator